MDFRRIVPSVEASPALKACTDGRVPEDVEGFLRRKLLEGHVKLASLPNNILDLVGRVCGQPELEIDISLGDFRLLFAGPQ
eukprot:1333355-Amphidinium_carterae.1